MSIGTGCGWLRLPQNRQRPTQHFPKQVLQDSRLLGTRRAVAEPGRMVDSRFTESSEVSGAPAGG